jgi:large subunit ribosomal protein L32e
MSEEDQKKKVKKAASNKTTKAKPAKKAAAPRKTRAAVEKPKAARKKPQAEAKAEAPRVAVRKKTVSKAAEAGVEAKRRRQAPAREAIVELRLLKIAQRKKRHLPEFRRENAHRWIRLSDSWRNVRGNDSYTRQKRKGRIAMVSVGYRTPKLTRDIHPSMHLDVPVHNVHQLEGLDPKIHAVRIGGTVGMRKRQEIIKKAEAKHLRVLNPGAPESAGEEELFSELDTEADKK